MHRIIFIHCGPFTYQEFILEGHVGLSGRWFPPQEALGQALRLAFDPEFGEELLWSWLREPSARLIFEIKGPKGWFLWLALGSKDGPVYHLIPTDYEAELFWDEKGRVKPEKKLWQDLKARKIKVVGPLSSRQEYLPLAREGKKNQERYHWLGSQPLELWSQTQAYLLAPEAGTWSQVMGGLLTWQPRQPTIGLTALRDKLQAMTLTYDEVTRIKAQGDLLQNWFGQYKAYEEGKKTIRELESRLAREQAHLRTLAAEVSQEEKLAQEALKEARKRKEIQYALVEQEIERSLRRLGALESGGDPIPPDAMAQLQAMQQEAAPLHQQLTTLQKKYNTLVSEWMDADQNTHPQRQQGQWSDLLTAREEQVQYRQQLEQAQQALRDLEGSRQQELRQLDQAEKEARAAFDAASTDAAQQIKALEERIAGVGQTLLGWLQDRYPDWEQNIGKVIREEVLFHPYLSPSVERLNDLLFGVSLDLSELETPIHGTRHLQAQLQEIQEQQQQRTAAWARQEEGFQRQRQNAEKRHKTRSSQLQREVQQARYALEQATLREKRRWNQLQEAQMGAEQQRERRKLSLRHRLSQLQAELLHVHHLLEEHRQTWRERLEQWSGTPSEGQEAYSNEQQRLVQWRVQAQAFGRELSEEGWVAEAEREARQAHQLRQLLEQEALPEATPPQGSGQLSLQDGLEMAQRLAALRLALTQQERDLRTLAWPILGQLRRQNALQLPTDPSAQDWLTRWGEGMATWTSEEGWQQLEDELQRQYVGLVAEVAELLPPLQVGDDPVAQRRLRRLNQRLGPSGAGTLTLEPGPLLRQLQWVQQLQQEQGLALAGSSLFAQNQDPAVQQQALAQLRALQAELERRPGESLGLTDAWRVTWRQEEGEEQRRLHEALADWPTGQALQGLIQGWEALRQERGEAALPLWLPESSRLDGETLAGLCQAARQAGLHLLMTGAQPGLIDQMDRAYWLEKKEAGWQAALLMERDRE